MDDITPWINGLVELLAHGYDHLEQGADFDLRLALISFDNTVEEAMKWYVSFNVKNPRFNGKPGFYDYLDKVMEHDGSIMNKSDIDLVKYFHDMRNKLYHGGANLSTDKGPLEKYYIVLKSMISKMYRVEIASLLDEKIQIMDSNRFSNLSFKYLPKIMENFFGDVKEKAATFKFPTKDEWAEKLKIKPLKNPFKKADS